MRTLRCVDKTASVTPWAIVVVSCSTAERAPFQGQYGEESYGRRVDPAQSAR
jgi:hypothetical protein